MSSSARLPFYVIGHKNPDTDAICSAIGHAALLRATGESEATAARCGDIPQRTAWVLEKAGIEAPPLVTDVRTSAGMICRQSVITADLTDTFLTAYRRMASSGVRCVPVVDADNRVHGILRYLDLLGLLLPAQTEGIAVRTVRASLANIATTLEADTCGNLPPHDQEEDLIMLVGASSQETVEARLKSAVKDGNIGRYLVICGDRPIVQRLAIDYGVRALLVTGHQMIDQNLRDRAVQKGVFVMETDFDTASSTTLIRCSRTVSHAMVTKFESVTSNEPVSKLRKRLTGMEQDLFPVVLVPGGPMIGVLSKSDLINPPRLRLALVDHNEYAQAVNGVEEAEVVEVIDHHRLAGDLVSREPIRYLNEPVGSTSTLVARKFLHRALTPEPGIAMCLCAGIVADTLCLTSPTTSELDHEMLKWLSSIAQIDPEQFTKDFFAVGSLMATGSAQSILNADRKEFSEDGFRVSISQVEELGLHNFDPRREELEAALYELVERENYDLAVLAVTDVAIHHSMVIAMGNDAIVSKLPFERLGPHLFDAPGVVSRKKQLFPAVSHALQMAR